jgi:excisionase family DNA binding protein
MKIYKITEASEYLGVSINTLKTLANNGKIKSFKTTGEHRRVAGRQLLTPRKDLRFEHYSERRM